MMMITFSLSSSTILRLMYQLRISVGVRTSIMYIIIMMKYIVNGSKNKK